MCHLHDIVHNDSPGPLSCRINAASQRWLDGTRQPSSGEDGIDLDFDEQADLQEAEPESAKASAVTSA